VGSHVRFHVASLQEGVFFGICGSLKAKGTGAVDFVGPGAVMPAAGGAQLP